MATAPSSSIYKISIGDVKESTVSSSSAVVFDWDNTLKQYNPEKRTLKTGVDRSILLKWKNDLKCQLFIISAIRPSKMNMETILIEIERLGLTDVFIEKSDDIQIVPNKYARKGNVIICGYDKAETFMDIFYGRKDFINVDKGDMLDSGPRGKVNVENDTNDIETDGPVLVDTMASTSTDTKVIFFDDEEVNIDNFSQLVKNSVCYHVI